MNLRDPLILIVIFKYIVAEALFLLNTACSQIVTFCFDLESERNAAGTE
ncbi:MAG: hypothetical protein IEMM0007_0513 [bacterium]|nr:MAG: hypothetical protein IEMM0007_0513 [bacterium]